MSETVVTQKDLQGVHEAWGEFKREFEQNRGGTEEKLEQIGVTLDAFETKNQEVLKLANASVQRSEAQEERMKELELELARRNETKSTSENWRDSGEFKALNQFCRGPGHFSGLDEETKALLRTDIATEGGVLAPVELDNAMLRNITEIDPLRGAARVRTVSSKSLEIPVRTGILTAEFEGEAEEGTDSTSSYGNETVIPYRQTVTVPITKDLLQDSSFDMESEIMTDAGEAFAVGEGTNFVSGNGVKRPSGFLSNAALIAGATTSASSGTINADDFMTLEGLMKDGYNPLFVFNRSTMAAVRKLKASTNQYLWLPGLSGGVTSTILGYPYIIAQTMPSLTANAYSVAFGDFRRGYLIVDRTSMSVVRDDLTQKRKAIVEFTLHRWLTGRVVLTEAIKLLKIKA